MHEPEMDEKEREEVSFEFHLSDVSKLFDSLKPTKNTSRRSDRFWCRGLEWSLSVEGRLEDQTKFLGFFLHCHNDDPQKWPCKVDGQFILFSNSSKNYMRRIQINFDGEKKTGRGYRKFIKYSELIHPKYGYTKDDKIVIGIKFQASPVIRGN